MFWVKTFGATLLDSPDILYKKVIALNEKVCCVFGAGDITDKVNIPDGAFIIAADGGLDHLNKLGIVPNVVLGDFDSFVTEKPNSSFVQYPKEKDYTDMFIAVQYGYDKGFRDFVIYGGLGGKRFDHSIANLQLLEHFAKKGCKVILYGKNEAVTAVSAHFSSPASISFDSTYEGYISLFAFGGAVTGLTIKGLKYELEDSLLTTDFPLCVSNEFCGKTAEISFNTGTLIIINSLM